MKYPTIINPTMVVAALQRSADIGATLEDDCMPLPDLNDVAAWDAFIVDPKPKLKGVKDEELVLAYNHIAPIDLREKQTKFLYDRLELRFTALVSRHLTPYSSVAQKWITKKAVDTLQDGLIDSDSSINRGLRTVFNVTVMRRRIDAQELWKTQKYKHPNLQFMSKPPDIADRDAASLVEVYALLQQVIKKLNAKQRAVLVGHVKGVLQAAVAEMPVRTRNRYLASTEKSMRGILDTKFAHSLSSETPRFAGPPITAMEVCLIGFSIACPQPSEADIEGWCRDFPQFAELIRECADDMRLERKEILEPHEADA